ncbi:MAG: hypothetical protein AABX73_01840 [Nanoarchaeota archaeon]
MIRFTGSIGVFYKCRLVINVIKKIKGFLILTIVLIIVVISIGLYFSIIAPPNNELCLQKVERENSFCSTIDEEQCKYYQNFSNSIPGGGNCRWTEESSVCTGFTLECD